MRPIHTFNINVSGSHVLEARTQQTCESSKSLFIGILKILEPAHDDALFGKQF